MKRCMCKRRKIARYKSQKRSGWPKQDDGVKELKDDHAAAPKDGRSRTRPLGNAGPSGSGNERAGSGNEGGSGNATSPSKAGHGGNDAKTFGASSGGGTNFSCVDGV